ncbi:MAG: tetratricopeptide repeat protein [Bacteroidales bacterium]|nr:tetratricopeptide repeat protein [Bacteroidales bacterium]
MNKNLLFVGCFAAVLLWSCGGGRKATAPADATRKPATDVTEETLRVDGLIIDAKTQQNIGNANAAARLYEAVLQADSTNAAAHYELGRIMYQQGWTESALTHARAAWQADKGNVWYGRLLAEVYKQAGNAKGLAEVWKDMVERNPEKIEFYYELANAQMAGGDAAAAVATLNRVERMIGVTEEVSLQKQQIWTYANNPDKALREIEALAEAYPQEKRYQAILSELYLKQGKRDKARRCYERIAAIDPEDEYVHISLASYYKQSGDMDRAYNELKRGFESNAIDVRSKLQILGSFYTAEEFYGKYSKHSFDLLEQLMKQTDDTSTYAAFYGDVLMRQERYPEAARQFSIAVRADSSQYQLWEAWLICESEVPGNSERLIKLSQRAAKLFPLHILPYFIQGQTNVSMKRYEEALPSLQQCVKIGFTNGYLEVPCYSLLAECHYRIGNYTEAWAAFDRCVQISGGDISVLNNYAYYLAEQGLRLEEAERMSRKTIDAEPDNGTYLDTYAWVLHRMGRNAEAKKYMERALKADGYRSDTLKEHYQSILDALQ